MAGIKKGGKADILVKDNENNPYLIIECKTTDSKNSEFIKEWNRMQEDGGQLFSYFQQEKGVKYLCLYTSDFSDKLEYKNYIIQAYDNEEYLKEKELQNSYKKSNNNIELFKTWKESYELQYFKQGIFEANVNAYKILEITPTFDNLKELKEEGKYHEFAKILRKHNISGKENAFDKLVNIFLCKIYDETFNKNNLKFGYFGVMADTYANMQDRLMWLYKEAMKEFLGEKITFVSNEDIEKDFKQLKIKTLKEVMQNYIKELKFYSNNDFAFLEVHNKELFLKNALVLKEIVELFANYKLTQNSTNQFLGKFDKELYENFLNGSLDSKLVELEAFKDYRNAFEQTSDYKKLKESKIYKESKDKQALEDKAFLAYAQAIEKDKLLYFCLSLNQEVLIIKSPSDIKEQKKFLGYEWSNRKGDEGLKELHEPYLSPLFERGNPQNETKLNTLICKAFLKTLSDIPKDLQGYAGKARLIDMMDFEKVEFNKAISLNPSNLMQNEMSNPFVNSKYELVEFGQLTKSLGKGRRPASFADSNGKYPFIKSSRILEKCNEYDFDIEALIIGDGGSANIHYINGKFSSSDHTYIFINNKKILFLSLFIM